MGVDVRIEDRVGFVALNRPDKRNAMSPQMTGELDAALNRLDDDPRVRAVVVHSTGAVFSAGTDLASGSGGPTPRGGPYGIAARSSRTPLIAAVEGPAVGGGFEIVLACDLVVASTGASFGLPEVSRGVVATCGALFRAPGALTATIAAELLLTGDPLSAERAHALGYVNRLCRPGLALDEATALARRISGNSPAAVSASLEALHRVVRAADDQGWAATDDAIAAVQASDDSREGVQAFLQRRSPQWSDPGA